VICLKSPDRRAGEWAGQPARTKQRRFYMHLIKVAEVSGSEEKLTQAVLQITQMLGIYNAELARILHLRCADIGALLDAHKNISEDTEAWARAIKYIEMYEALYYLYEGNEIKINNWLRKKHKGLQAIPLYLMVDEQKINQVIDVLN